MWLNVAFSVVWRGETTLLYLNCTTAEAILEFQIYRQYVYRADFVVISGGKNGGVLTARLNRKDSSQKFNQYDELLTQLCLKYSVQCC